MKAYLYFTILFCTALPTHGDTITQTTWTGESGIQGPVTQWSSNFFSALDVYTRESGEISFTDCHQVLLDSLYEYTYTPGAADFNGDGFMDVIASPLDYHTSWWENIDGSGNSWQEHQIMTSCSLGIHFNHAVDIDGDGNTDVCGGSYWGECVLWWENADGSGTNWVEKVIDSSIETPVNIASGDFDNDLDQDIVCVSSDADLYWYENVDGSGASWNEYQLGDMNAAKLVSVSDVNGDGRMDVVAFGVGDGLVWFENSDDGKVSWTEHPIDGCYLYGMDTKDLNLDGYIDVIGCSENDRIQWWENLDGQGLSWSYHIIDDVYISNDGLYTCDIDGDGDLDVTATSWHVIYWWENLTGAGNSWARHYVSRYFSGASDVYAADLNSDGAAEIISTVFQGDDCGLAYWEIADIFSCSLISSILFLGNDPGWDSLDFTAVTPPGTNAGIAIRSTDELPMDDWADTLWESGSLVGILPENDSYFQYMAVLLRDDTDTTPVLHDVTLSWNPVSLSDVEEPVPGGTILLPVSPSPVTGSVVIDFSLGQPSVASIRIFDLTGRMVFISSIQEYEPGRNSINAGKLIPGVYFASLFTEDEQLSSSFVVIRD